MPKTSSKMNEGDELLEPAKNASEEEVNKYIGTRIREIRDARHVSAETVATYLKMKRTNLSHIETGRNRVSAITLWKLAALLKCPVSHFFPDIPDGYEIMNYPHELDILRKIDPRIDEWAKECIVKAQKTA